MFFIFLHKKSFSCQYLHRIHNLHSIIPVAQTKKRPGKTGRYRQQIFIRQKQLFFKLKYPHSKLFSERGYSYFIFCIAEPPR